MVAVGGAIAASLNVKLTTTSLLIFAKVVLALFDAIVTGVAVGAIVSTVIFFVPFNEIPPEPSVELAVNVSAPCPNALMAEALKL